MEYAKLVFVKSESIFRPVTVGTDYSKAKSFNLDADTEFTPVCCTMAGDTDVYDTTAFLTANGHVFVPLPFVTACDEGLYKGTPDIDTEFPELHVAEMFNKAQKFYDNVSGKVKFKYMADIQATCRSGYPGFTTVFVDSSGCEFIASEDIDF